MVIILLIIVSQGPHSTEQTGHILWGRGCCSRSCVAKWWVSCWAFNWCIKRVQVLEIVSLGVWEEMNAILCVWEASLGRVSNSVHKFRVLRVQRRSHGLGPSRPIRWQATVGLSQPIRGHWSHDTAGVGSVCAAAIRGNPRSTEKFVLFALCATEKSVLGGYIRGPGRQWAAALTLKQGRCMDGPHSLPRKLLFYLDLLKCAFPLWCCCHV